jgi:hypothetical protein
MSNGEHGFFDLVFKSAVGIFGSIIGVVMVGGGRKILEHDRAIGELVTARQNAERQREEDREAEAARREAEDKWKERVENKLDKLLGG